VYYYGGGLVVVVRFIDSQLWRSRWLHNARGYGGGRVKRGVSHRHSQRNSVTAGGVYHSARAEVATDRYIPSPWERDVKKKSVTKTKPVRSTEG